MIAYKRLAQIILGVLIFSSIVYSCSRCNVVEVKRYGVVKSKATSSSQTGNISYHTIILGDDGRVYDKGGIKFYAVPVGDKVYWTDAKIEFK